jgi:Secretion system C-terminal sorting domain
MKKLQLCLAMALYCCMLMGQAPRENSAASQAEEIPFFSFFTVVIQNGNALLRWSALPVRAQDFFIVEKSFDGEIFETISAMDASVGSDSIYSVMDNSVGAGTVAYRIRIAGKDGREILSKTVNASIVASDFRFYPNPVDKFLIIRSSHALKIQVVDVNGIVWFGQEVEAGMQVVNVASLKKGNYIIKATDQETNSVVSQQLVKNN